MTGPEVGTAPADVDAELGERGIAFTDEGMWLRRLPWMTDAQWDYVKTAMTAWWDGFLAGFKIGRDPVGEK